MGERADRGLLKAMQRWATATAGEFKPQNVANLLWPPTMGERVDRDLLEAMQSRRCTPRQGQSAEADPPKVQMSNDHCTTLEARRAKSPGET